MDEFSRAGKKEGSIFLPHTNIRSTQIGILERACTQKKREEHRHGMVSVNRTYKKESAIFYRVFLNRGSHSFYTFPMDKQV
jgi:hypothetical protein